MVILLLSMFYERQSQRIPGRITFPEKASVRCDLKTAKVNNQTEKTLDETASR